MVNSSVESSEESETEVHTLQTPRRHTCINAQYHSNSRLRRLGRLLRRRLLRRRLLRRLSLLLRRHTSLITLKPFLD